MSQSFTTEDLKTLLVFPFRDAKWQNKLLIAGLLSLGNFVVPLVPSIFLTGYTARIMRRITVEGGEPFLPEWDDWGQMFVEGLKLFCVNLVYSLPALLLMFVGFAFFFGASWLPLFTAESASAPEAVVPFFAAMAVGMALFGLATVLSLAAGVIVPAPLNHLVVTGDFEAAFRFREWWAIFRANVGGFLLSYAILMGLGMVLGLAVQILYLTVVLCCLAPIVLALVGTYSSLVSAAIFAQAYRAGAQKLDAQTDLVPA